MTVSERCSGCSVHFGLRNDSCSGSNTRALMPESSARLVLGLISSLIGGVHASATTSKSTIWLCVCMVARLTHLVDEIADQRATLRCRILMVCACVLCRRCSSFLLLRSPTRSLQVNGLKYLLQLETLFAGRLRVEDPSGPISIFPIFLCRCLTLLCASLAHCTIDLLRASLQRTIILRLLWGYTHSWGSGRFLGCKSSLLRSKRHGHLGIILAINIFWSCLERRIYHLTRFRQSDSNSHWTGILALRVLM